MGSVPVCGSPPCSAPSVGGRVMQSGDWPQLPKVGELVPLRAEAGPSGHTQMLACLMPHLGQVGGEGPSPDWSELRQAADARIRQTKPLPGNELIIEVRQGQYRVMSCPPQSHLTQNSSQGMPG